MHHDTSPDLNVVGKKLKDVLQGGCLAAAGILGILEKIRRDTVRDGEIPKTVIAMEGVLYEHYTRYRHCLENTLRELVGDQLAKHIELIIHSNDVGCIGAALLAASHSQYL
ncbi:hexokinase-1-like protein [Tanacetum coccineum]